MQYFHRTSMMPDAVLGVADDFLSSHFTLESRTDRDRTFRGPIGTLKLHVRPEGGHYTLITIETDQVTESEADKVAKRLLGVIHKTVEPAHKLRGAY